MKPRIYIDTSIVGGYFDIEFERETKALFERFKNNEIIFVVSDLLYVELLNAPDKVKNLLAKYESSQFEHIEMNEQVEELANKYIEEKVVGKTSIEDCRHIALGTINNVNILASWNFKHIVNYDRIRGYNAINIREGYNLLEIRSPKDLIKHKEDEK